MEVGAKIDGRLAICSTNEELDQIKIDIESYAKISKLSMVDAKDGANEYINKLKRDINKELSAFSRIYDVKLQEEPFERTPTQKIKRFIYSKAGIGKNKDEKKK
jgi:long-chain acyl-CoA synthetase